MNELSRRSFLLGGAGAVMAGAGWVARPAAAEPGPRRPTSAALVRSTFLPLVGAAFRMSNRVWSSDVVLEAVEDLRPALAPGDENRFGLVFRADGGARARQGTYRLRSPRTGAFDLFTVPVDRGRTSDYYQVVVDRAV